MTKYGCTLCEISILYATNSPAYACALMCRPAPRTHLPSSRGGTHARKTPPVEETTQIYLWSRHCPNTQQQLNLYALSCVKPGLDYFMSKYTGDLAKQIGIFKAARLFVPHKVVQLSPTASTVDSLDSFPFLVPLLPALKTELPTYLALASGISVEVEPTVWWKQNKAELPHWSHAFTEVV